MLAGHLASAIALKARTPQAPTWGLVVGVFLLDILFGLLWALGIEHATLTPGVDAGFRLDFIDWSHSLATSIVWAALFGGLWLRRGRVVAGMMAVAVFSHFVLDLPVHPPDMALWPNASTHLGLGLWRTPFWWWFELAVVAACLGYAFVRTQRRRALAWGSGVALALHAVNAPWLAVGR